MTQLYQRNPTHHVLLARQFSGGNGPHDGGPGANSPPPRTGTTGMFTLGCYLEKFQL